MNFLTRLIRPKDVIKHFRYSSPLKQRQIADIKNELRGMSEGEIKKLLNTPLENLSKREFDLVLYAGTTFPEFGFPNKTIIQMKPQEFTKLKRNVNRTVEDMMSGKNVEIVQAGSTIEIEPGKLKMTDSPLLGGELRREKGKEKISPTKIKAEPLPDDEFYQPSFFFDEDIRTKKSTGSVMIGDERLNAIVNSEIKNIQQYGDSYWSSGTGLFGRLKQSIGDSGEGARMFRELQKANQSGGLGYSTQELYNFANEKLQSAFPEDAAYRLSSDMLPKTKKYGGGMLSNDENRYGYKDGGPGIEALRKEAPEVVERMGYEEGGSLLADDMAMMQEEQEMPTHTMPDGTVMPGATHEEGEMMMEESEEPEMEMESDSEMEDNYLDFIIDEALSEEEEDMLMSKLEQDEELSMLFDKVIEVASEFAGSGPVEGPGTGVSDSIPARLSDGEFVFTAKAVEEIGADNLMAMMKDAEARADERQPLQGGGQPDELYQPESPQMTEQVIRVETTPRDVAGVGVAGSMLDPRREEELNPLYDEMAFKRPPVHGAGYT